MKLNFQPFSLNLHGALHNFSRPAIMGIINVTPDSFFAGSRTFSYNEIKSRTARIIDEGAEIIDLGAYSSRPGAEDVTPAEETRRLATAMSAIRSISTSIPVSVDTFRADIARKAVTDMGADIINDISGGSLDSTMFETMADLNVPYILMHMRGTPATMQSMTDYSGEGGVVNAIIRALRQSIEQLDRLGVPDIIIDPGLGFAKTIDQNYTILANLQQFHILGKPILIGLSRKSMLCKPLSTTPDKVLNATTAAHAIALMSGASILRVHDVREAIEARTIVEQTNLHKSL